jgi:O-antigen ligase
MRIKIYYLLVFIYSFIFSDLNFLTFISIDKLHVYYIDLIYLYGWIVALSSLFYVNKYNHKGAALLFGVFILWIIFEVFRGMYFYGTRSIGESRYISFLFMAFIPYSLIKPGTVNVKEQLAKLLGNTIIIAGVAGFIMFVIEFSIGGRLFLSEVNQHLGEYAFADARGVRYLDVYHVYNMMFLGVFLLMRVTIKGKSGIFGFFFAFILFAVCIFTKGRTSIFSIGLATLLYTVLFLRISLLFRAGLIILFVLGMFILLFPSTLSMFYNISTEINPFSNPIDITGSASWRKETNNSAYLSALKTFWFGQGYGGYFKFNIKSLSVDEITMPVHNLYILLFMKTGIIGIVLFGIFYIYTFIKLFVIYLKHRFSPTARFNLGILAIFFISQIIYGFGFGFIPFFGLYSGYLFLFLGLYNKEDHPTESKSSDDSKKIPESYRY